MDRMRACGVCDPGSIPGEGTKAKKEYSAIFFFMFCEPEQYFISR